MQLGAEHLTAGFEDSSIGYYLFSDLLSRIQPIVSRIQINLVSGLNLGSRWFRDLDLTPFALTLNTGPQSTLVIEFCLPGETLCEDVNCIQLICIVAVAPVVQTRNRNTVVVLTSTTSRFFPGQRASGVGAAVSAFQTFIHI